MTDRTMPKRRGAPLATLVVLVGAWIGLRAMLWENPFPHDLLERPFQELLADAPAPITGTPKAASVDDPITREVSDRRRYNAIADQVAAMSVAVPKLRPSSSPFSDRTAAAGGHQVLWLAAMSYLPMPRAVEEALMSPPQSGLGNAPFSPRSAPPTDRDRWTLDGWAFWREGSNSTAISQGRVPIYGASQVGAVLQYRIAPQASRDPRAYVRAYRALVTNGETELAAGLSARPLPKVPLRMHAEVRATDRRFGSEIRPSAFVTTELASQDLPFGLSGEAYGQAGYVGGDDATFFADGQVAVTRRLAEFDLAAMKRTSLSVGGAAWAGAQDDAHRVDLGPTMRLDLTIAEIPARLSIDWRERVAGDAAPSSGMAATLSTRF